MDRFAEASLASLRAIVTGGVGGIGSATVELLARGRAHVAIVDIDADAARSSAESLAKKYDTTVIGIQADVTKSDDVERYTNQVAERFGGINAVFNNAGMNGSIIPFTEYPDELFDRICAVNQRGVYLGVKHAARHMLKSGNGSIVNTASVAGLMAFSSMPGYIASKHAVIGITRAAALEFAPHGIRVNAVCPAPIDTQLMRDVETAISATDPLAVRKSFVAGIPMGRYGTPEEVAQLVCFLLSDQSRYICGAAIPIDGASTVD